MCFRDIFAKFSKGEWHDVECTTKIPHFRVPQQWLMPEKQESSSSCKSLLSAEVWALLEWAYAMLFLESCPGNSCLPQLGSPPGSLHFPLTPENLWPKLTEDVIEICTLANSVINKGAVSSASSYGPLERLERPISFFQIAQLFRKKAILVVC